MKFEKNITRIIICFLILISNFAQIYLAKEKIKRMRNRTSNRRNKVKYLEQYKTTSMTGVQFHSRYSGGKGNELRAFNLNGSAKLVARCPRSSVLIKLIFQKRNDHVLDVGFNCRRDMKNISSDVVELTHKVESNSSFDTITPPNVECPADRALSGYEFEHINKITYFKHYCTKVFNMHDKSITSDKWFPNDASVLDPIERKSLSRFFSHTDITVAYDRYSKYVINSISFTRTGGESFQQTNIPGTLSYNFSTSKVGISTDSGKDTNIVRSDIKKTIDDKVTADSTVVISDNYGLSIPQLKILEKILNNINNLTGGIFDAKGVDFTGLTENEKQELLKFIYKLSQLYSGIPPKFVMGAKDKNGLSLNILKPLSFADQARVTELIKKLKNLSGNPTNNTLKTKRRRGF